MRTLVDKDIENFYNCFQAELHSTVNVDDSTIDLIFDKGVEQVNSLRMQAKAMKNNPAQLIPIVLPMSAEQNCISKILNEFNDRHQDECKLSYTREHLEYLIWARVLLLMSWILILLKHKVEEGHCRNEPSHRHGSQHMLCPQGSKFHLDFYNECLQSLENIIESAKLNPPKLVRS